MSEVNQLWKEQKWGRQSETRDYKVEDLWKVTPNRNASSYSTTTRNSFMIFYIQISSPPKTQPFIFTGLL